MHRSVWRTLAGVLAVGAMLIPGAAAAAPPVGPDVSRYQHGSPINWNRVASSGSSFAFVKATEGTTVLNPYFASDWSAIRAASLYRGAYHYARPSAAAGSAGAQARYFARTIGAQNLPGTLPPVLDLESSGGLSPAQLVTWARSFLETLEAETGRRPLIYTFPHFWRTAMGNTTALNDYPLWIAHYVSGPQPTTLTWPTWTFWQYTSSGRIPGIAGGLDVNRFNGTAEELAALALAAPPSVDAPVVDGVTAPTPVTGDTTAGATGGSTAPVTDQPPVAVRTTPSPPGRYTAIEPTRFVDTRTGLGAPQGAGGGALTVKVPDSIPANASGVVLNVSAVEPTGRGYLRVSPPGQAAATTALNFSARSSMTGLVLADIDADRRLTLSVSGGPTQLVADAVGYFDSATGSGGHWVPLPAARFVDSRTGLGTERGEKTGPVTITLPATVPAGARGAVLNVSVVDASRDVYVRVAAAGKEARTTALNVSGGRSLTQLVLTGAADNKVTITLVGGPAQLVVDLVGYYDEGSSSGSSFIAAEPQRLTDTRADGSARQPRTVTVPLPAGVPADATGLLLAVSTVAPVGNGYVRVAGAGRPATTTAINFADRESQTGLVLTGLGDGGAVTLQVFRGTADLVVDLVGYQTAR